MNQYRFSNRRVRCTRCGARRGFAPLVGRDGDVSEKHGKCHACGVFFAGNNAVTNIPHETDTAFSPATRTLSPLELAPYLYPVVESNLLRGLLTSFAAVGLGDALLGQLQNFDVWSDCDGNAVFAYWNASEQLVTVKTVPYDETGHRVKELGARFGIRQRRGTWEDGHAWQLFTAKRGYRPCLYGEFQLSPRFLPSPDRWSSLVRTKDDPLLSPRPVCLVESEKTCIITSLFLPEFVFLATGGATGLSDEKAELLANINHPVLIVPDNDLSGRNGAMKSLRHLRSRGCDARIVPVARPNDPPGYDLADAILNELARRTT